MSHRGLPLQEPTGLDRLLVKMGKEPAPPGSWEEKPHLPALDPEDTFPLTRLEILDQVRAIARKLEAGLAEEGRERLPWDLAGGISGFALLLAGLERVAGGGWGELARRLLAPIETAGAERNESLGLGALSGWGSVLYALAALHRLTDREELLQRARALAEVITPERIEQEYRPGVADGLAGAILGLVALHESGAGGDALGRARLCAESLLERRRHSPAGPRSWPDEYGHFQVGLGSGAAGIAYALLKLYGATREEDLSKAAREAIAYESSLFSPSHGSWPDLEVAPGCRQSDRFPSGWLRGASGVGLARLAGMDLLDTPAIRVDLESALRVAERTVVTGTDDVEGGNLGRFELLLQASRRLERPELRFWATRQAAHVVARKRVLGSFQLPLHQEGSLEGLGFLRGITGVGYQLLRLGYPDSIPPVLLWA